MKILLISALLLVASNGWAEETYRECLERADKKGSEKLGGFNAIMKECRALEDYIDDKWKLLEEERYQESERVFAERKRQAEWKVVAAEYKRKQDALAAEEAKQELLTQLIERCTGYGFTGESNIAACIQREAFNDRQLAQQRYEFQTQLLKQANEAQETTKALEAQLARSKASEEIALIQSIVNQGMWIQEMMKN